MSSKPLEIKPIVNIELEDIVSIRGIKCIIIDMQLSPPENETVIYENLTGYKEEIVVRTSQKIEIVAEVIGD